MDGGGDSPSSVARQRSALCDVRSAAGRRMAERRPEERAVQLCGLAKRWGRRTVVVAAAATGEGRGLGEERNARGDWGQERTREAIGTAGGHVRGQVSYCVWLLTCRNPPQK
jgi:hypothetical protein